MPGDVKALAKRAVDLSEGRIDGRTRHERGQNNKAVFCELPCLRCSDLERRNTRWRRKGASLPASSHRCDRRRTAHGRTNDHCLPRSLGWRNTGYNNVKRRRLVRRDGGSNVVRLTLDAKEHVFEERRGQRDTAVWKWTEADQGAHIVRTLAIQVRYASPLLERVEEPQELARSA